MIETKIHVRDLGVKDMLRRLAERSQNLRPVMAEIGDIVVESVQRNFEEHRSPSGIRWRALSARYLNWKTQKKGRSASDILILNRILMGSLNRRAEQTRVTVGVGGGARDYAAIHQFGGRTGRGGRANMPARPYLGVRTSDWAEIKRALIAHITRGE